MAAEQCEHIIFDKTEGVNRRCRHPGTYHTGGKFVCATHDPRSDAESENRWRDLRAKDRRLRQDFRKHGVSHREIIEGIVDRALTMLRATQSKEG